MMQQRRSSGPAAAAGHHSHHNGHRHQLRLAPRRRPHQPGSAGGGVVCRSELGDSMGLLMKPELAAVLSAGVAAVSAVMGSTLAEEKRARLEKEIESERRARLEVTEMASIVARYRGPLLESCVDLEQRFWHAVTRTGEWTPGVDALCFEEVSYTLFCVAQLLGFMEVCRREGPRERNFLDEGSLAGSDTLFTLLEGMRFAMCASPATLAAWGAEGDGRDHPGARERRFVSVLRGGGGGRGGDDEEGDEGDASRGPKPSAVVSAAAAAAAPGARAAANPHIPMRISRGMQRAIGAMMVTTAPGAKRHYTQSYSDFVARLKTDAAFAAWFQPLEESLAELLAGPCWDGAPPFPLHRWTRVLLLQQLLVEAFDLLDPSYCRIMPSRRMRLSPIAYRPLPNLEAYQARLSLLSRGAAAGGQGAGGSSSSSSPYGEALANLRDPSAVARRGGAFSFPPPSTSAGANGGAPSSSPPQWPLPWPGTPGAGSPGGGQGSPSASGVFDAPAALARAADALHAAATGAANGGQKGGGGGGQPLFATKIPPNAAAAASSPVLPIAEVRARMGEPHAGVGAAAGRADSPGALLQDVVGTALLQRLKQEQEQEQQQQGGGDGEDGDNGGNGGGSSNGTAQRTHVPGPVE